MEYGLIGKTLGHSFSKIVHEALTDYQYELCPLPTEEIFQKFMEERQFSGINVTIPYKQAVIPFCESLDAKAEAIGAVNTIVNREGKLYGYNTDYDGFLYLAESTGVELRGKVLLILGTGGTYKTVTAVAKDQGVKEILTASRQPQEGQISYEEARTLEKVQVIVNTSPVGMYPDNQGLPISLDNFPHLTGVLDVVYNPLCSTLVQKAREKGVPACGGLDMLIAQAKYAGEHFQGKKISDSAMAKVSKQIAQRQSNLVLIGMPSCGKSALGKWCAQDMGRTFVDLDVELEKKAGKPISKIFEEMGEDGFRALETEVCREFSKENSLVISTGGGVVTRHENMEALLQNAVIFYVKRPLEKLQSGGNRPLSTNSEKIAELFRVREPLYQKYSNKEIENDSLVNAVAQMIQEAYYEIFNSERT